MNITSTPPCPAQRRSRWSQVLATLPPGESLVFAKAEVNVASARVKVCVWAKRLGFRFRTWVTADGSFVVQRDVRPAVPAPVGPRPLLEEEGATAPGGAVERAKTPKKAPPKSCTAVSPKSDEDTFDAWTV